MQRQQYIQKRHAQTMPDPERLFGGHSCLELKNYDSKINISPSQLSYAGPSLINN